MTRTTLRGASTGGVLRTVLFWCTAAALVTANAIIAAHSIAIAPLWEDEAYNLTVPLNMARGLGYTSDGILFGGELLPFDVRISTGPGVLLPVVPLIAAGIDPAVAGRLVALGFYAALVAGAAFAAHRLAGRWAALAAAAVLLAFDASAPPSPIQGPADLLGEIPAAALLLWAAIVVPRAPWIAGLLLGLAVEAKTISLLAVPALVLATLLTGVGALGRRARQVLVAAGAAIAPTALFELAALISLGPGDYALRLRSMGYFLLTGGQTYQATSPIQKTTVLAESWFLPPGIVVAIVVVVVGFAAWNALDASRHRDEYRAYLHRAGLAPARTIASQLLVAAVGLTTFVAWWAFAAHTPLWVRHPAPGVLAYTPLLLAGIVLAVRWRLHRARSAGSRILPLGIATVVAAMLATQVSLHALAALSPPERTLAAQRTLAAELGEVVTSPWIAVPWGSAVSIGVLAGIHVGLTDSPSSAGLPTFVPAAGAPPCTGRALVLDEWQLCVP